MTRHADMFAAHGLPVHFVNVGATFTYTVTPTAAASSISGRLTEIDGTEHDRLAEFSLHTDATLGVVDPQPGHTVTESGGTVWIVDEVQNRTGGRHLLSLHVPRAHRRPII